MLLIQSLASSTLSARRPIDCDAAGPAGDGIMGGSRSVADGCARGLTPSGPQVRARHRRSPSEGVARLWFGRQNRGDADQSDHPDAPRRRGGLYRTPLRRDRQRRQHNGYGEDHHESGWRLPRRVPHRKQGESGKQHGPGELGVPAHPGSAGHSTHDVRSVDRWVPDRDRVHDLAGSGGLLRFRHYANLSSLLAGKVNRERTIPRSLSG